MPGTCASRRASDVIAGLTKAAIEERLTPDFIGEAIAVTDRRNGQLTRSAGMNWIAANVEWFAETVPDAAEFFGRHIHVPYVMQVFNLPEVFDLLQPEHRFGFMAAAFGLHRPPTGNHWVAVMMNAKMPVPEHQIAQLIKIAVEASDIDLRSRHRDFTTDQFLRVGAGTPRLRDTTVARFRPGSPVDFAQNWVLDDQQTMWSVLSNTELTELILLIIEREPRVLFQPVGKYRQFSVRQLLLMRMAYSDVEYLFRHAARQLTSFNSVALEEFCWLPVEVQKETVDRVRYVPLVLLVGVALDIDNAYDAINFVRAHKANFRHAARGELLDVAHLYWQELNRDDRTLLGKEIRQPLERQLEKAGFKLAHPSAFRRNRNRSFSVELNGITYRRHRHQDENPPKHGDTVLIDTRHANRLNEKLYATDFYVLG